MPFRSTLAVAVATLAVAGPAAPPIAQARPALDPIGVTDPSPSGGAGPSQSPQVEPAPTVAAHDSEAPQSPEQVPVVPVVEPLDDGPPAALVAAILGSVIGGIVMLQVSLRTRLLPRRRSRQA